MSDEANHIRIIAAEIIRKLWQAGETVQLELLMEQAKASLNKPFKKKDNHDDDN